MRRIDEAFSTICLRLRRVGESIVVMLELILILEVCGVVDSDGSENNDESPPRIVEVSESERLEAIKQKNTYLLDTREELTF